MPAFGLWKFRPDGHATADHSVCKNPKERAGCGLLNFFAEQARPSSCAGSLRTVTSRTMLLVELATSTLLLWHCLRTDWSASPTTRVLAPGRCKPTVHAYVLGRLFRLHLRRQERHAASNKQRGHDDSVRHLHERPPNSCLTKAPKPENSRETPQRKSNRWLLSLRPNPLDRRNVQSEGRFQAIAGAR